MIAYLHRAPGKTFVLTILDSASAQHFADGTCIKVAGKREARAYCKANGIKPWNF